MVIPDTMDMVTNMAALLLLIPRDKKATTVDTTVADTVTATDAPLQLILRDKKATTVDTTVADTVTATVAPLLLIPKDRKATTEDTTLVMVATIMADIITTKLMFSPSLLSECLIQFESDQLLTHASWLKKIYNAISTEICHAEYF